MAKLSNEELIEQFEGMTLVELSEFVKLFEEKFDVTAAAPAAVTVAAGPAAATEEVEEKTEFDVVLESFGDNKMPVLKAIRPIAGLGLKETKELVEGAPSTVLEGVKKEEAEKAKEAIEAAGGTVTLK